MAAKPTPPPPLPSWMVNFDPNEQTYGPLSPGYRTPEMGYAEMDQYNANGASSIPSGGMADRIVNGYQGLTSLDPQGYAVAGRDPSGGDRVNRALQGLLSGYDTGNTAGNVGLQVGASMVPGGALINRGAGAVQGAMSDDKVFDRMLPSGGNSGPGMGSPDVMPRGISAGGLLPSQDTSGSGAGYGAMPGGPADPRFAANPPNTRGLAGQGPVQPGAASAAPGSGFTGGSGRPVDPYSLPAANDLETLLAQAQRYTDYDASTGRTGFAGGATGAGGYAYSGFDFGQDPGNRDIGKSAKYAFSHFSEQAAKSGVPQPRTKAEAEAWFSQHIAPGLQAAGYEIEWIKGDKARIKTREGWDTIDFVGGADGDSPVITWQSEELAPGGGMSTGAGSGGVGAGLVPNAGMDLTSSAFFDQIMQQVRDIAAGKSNGALATDTNALINLLVRN